MEVGCASEARGGRRRWLPVPLPRISLPLLGLGGAAQAARRRRRAAAARGNSRFASSSGAAPLAAWGAAAAAAPPAAQQAAPALAALTAALPPLASAPGADEPPRRAAAAPAAAARAAAAAPAAARAAAKAKVATRPASDVLAGALARAASQSIIHPLDTLKVRLQANVRAAAKAPPPAAPPGAAPGPATAAAPPPPPPAAAARGLSKFGRLVPPAGADPRGAQLRAAGAGVASLYKGVVGAASGAGIAIGAYFAFYSAACNLLAAHTSLAPGAVAFAGGAAAAAGSSVVKVPLAVCIRSVQAGVYPNVFAAARSITRAAGPAGLFTGYWPTLLEDVPDMACKFAAYESMRSLHRRAVGGRDASPGEDFAMGALAGAAAAAATTPLDVVKTRMMCAAASRPTMGGAAAAVLAAGGPGAFFSGVGARALSNGINSAVFFCAFEAIRGAIQKRGAVQQRAAATAAAAGAGERIRALPAAAARAEDGRERGGGERGAAFEIEPLSACDGEAQART